MNQGELLLIDANVRISELERELTECRNMLIRWRLSSEHGELFTDGERMLVAVPCCDSKQTDITWWDICAIVIHCDEGQFDITAQGEPWGWDWDDVEWWVPIAEIEPGSEP